MSFANQVVYKAILIRRHANDYSIEIRTIALNISFYILFHVIATLKWVDFPAYRFIWFVIPVVECILQICVKNIPLEPFTHPTIIAHLNLLNCRWLHRPVASMMYWKMPSLTEGIGIKQILVDVLIMYHPCATYTVTPRLYHTVWEFASLKNQIPWSG